MRVHQILHPDLGCASYLIVDDGEAAVVDPKWEVEEYLTLAAASEAEIRHILETHTHADHVSGRRRLAERTEAAIHLPADPESPEPDRLRDGDVIRVGGAEVRALASPGHRPEHLAFTIHPHPGAPVTHLLSGDSLLLGSVARPDLAVEATEGAVALHGSLQRLLALDDEVSVWPAHVGGSLCGATSLTGETFSTLGRERQRNHLLSISQPEFVTELTGVLPVRPPRAQSVVARNRGGASEPEPMPELSVQELSRRLADGACVLDLRAPYHYDARHLTGSLNLPPAVSGIGNRAGWATEENEPLVLLADDADRAAVVAEQLRAAGIWNLTGTATFAPQEWEEQALASSTTGAYAPDEVRRALEEDRLLLIDVRDDSEWEAGHVEGSLNLPLSRLRTGRDLDLPHDVPIAVACAAGARAALAASVLRRRGYERATRMTGGIPDLLVAAV